MVGVAIKQRHDGITNIAIHEARVFNNRAFHKAQVFIDKADVLLGRHAFDQLRETANVREQHRHVFTHVFTELHVHDGVAVQTLQKLDRHKAGLSLGQPHLALQALLELAVNTRFVDRNRSLCRQQS